MEIDNSKYKLPKTNYHRTANKKRQIVVGNTFSSDMKHYNGWLTRHNGLYKKTAAFTIDINGNIYQHYDPKYYSDFLIDKKANINSIPVVIENCGWLIKAEDNTFNTWVGNKFIDENIVNIVWRSHSFWCEYNDKQVNSLVELSKYLCKKFNIPKTTIGHNTKVEDIYQYNGVVFRSNYQKHSTDLTPAWDYEKFKNILENE